MPHHARPHPFTRQHELVISEELRDAVMEVAVGEDGCATSSQTTEGRVQSGGGGGSGSGRQVHMSPADVPSGKGSKKRQRGSQASRGNASPRPSTSQGREARDIVDVAEHYMFKVLKKELTGFDERNWVGHGRLAAYLWLHPLFGEGGNPPPFAFVYKDDDEGTWTGEAGALCFIQVKSTPHGPDSPFNLSGRELRLAGKLQRLPDQTRQGQTKHLHALPKGLETAVYVVVRVGYVGCDREPAWKWHVDPMALFMQGKLQIRGASMC
jgi:hypothetical protein